jgi:hypothetical protein
MVNFCQFKRELKGGVGGGRVDDNNRFFQTKIKSYHILNYFIQYLIYGFKQFCHFIAYEFNFNLNPSILIKLLMDNYNLSIITICFLDLIFDECVY